jgi:Protein of unknown function (DUF3833)
MRAVPSLALACTALLAACATRPGLPAETAASAVFRPEVTLAGTSYGRGAFRSITGVKREFVVELNGAWDGQTLTLREEFRYLDGVRETKTWRLTRVGEGRYRGTREDVVGEATGFVDGPAFRLEYMMALPKKDGGERRVKFRDVLVTDAKGDVINRANVSWRGVRVGSVDLKMSRRPL